MQLSVTDRIEEDIVFGVYPPGSRLVEEQLITRFGVSRYALRSVFTELEQRGLVVRYPNRGVEVVEPTPDEIDELYEIRELLESHAAETTSLPVDAAIAGELEELVEKHASAAAEGDIRQVFRLNVRLHRLQYGACPNARLARTIEDHARKVHVVRAVKYGDSGHLERVVRQHREILAAMRGMDNARYVAAVRAHLPDSKIAYRKVWDVKYGPTGTSQSRRTG